MEEKKALIAMSGGVDSSAAAYLMKQAGFSCIGATMKLFDKEAVLTCKTNKAADSDATEAKTCGSGDDIEDARMIAMRLGMPFYVFDFSGEFKKQVIDRFIRAYEKAMTPNPCVDCNRYLKFDRLYEEARALGCEYLATGHYAQITMRDGRYLLKKAADPAKDQSYVLFSLTQEQLAHTYFPLGAMTKEEARAVAADQGFINASKKDSQDICFVPDGDYAGVIRAYTGRVYPKGNFVDAQGVVLGEHKGMIHYTIGQRKGLGLALPKPMYVCRLDTEKNQVVLGDNADLFTKELEACDMNWMAWENPPKEFRAKAKVRYRQAEQWATVYPKEDGRMQLTFDEPQRAITKGQAVVLYQDDLVVGGGTIC